MTTMTRYQQAQYILKIKNLRGVHEYYQSNPGCTMKQVSTFTTYSYHIIKKYSKIRTECLTVISAVIDVRYGCVWPQDEIRGLEVVQGV